MATAKKLPSERWRVRVYDKVTKSTKSFTADTKRQAEHMADTWLESRRREVSKTATVKSVVQQYIDERKGILSPASIDKYQRTLDGQLSDELKNIPLIKLKVADIKNEISRLSAHYSPKSVKCAAGLFLPIIRKQRPDLDLDDITLPKVYKKQKVYPDPNKIIEAFKGDRMELEVLLGLCYGLRKEEIRGIMPADIKDGILTINRVVIDVDKKPVVREGAAKTQSSLRKLRLSKYVLDLIAQRSGEFVCCHSGHAIYMHFARKMEKLGYKGVTFHDLRHINASVMLFLGVPTKYAQERGGWATDYTLKQVYQSTFSEQRDRFDTVVDSYFGIMYDENYAADKKNTENKPSE